jgi:hypothetical protein
MCPANKPGNKQHTVPSPFPAGGVVVYGGGGVPGLKPTAEWIGKPTPADIELFLCCLFNHVATRPRGVGKHQGEQIEGDFIAYARPSFQMRGTDRSQRIYAGVRVLEITGETNFEGCRRVAEILETRIGKTKRGGRRKGNRPPDFFDKIATVRSLYNRAKDRHRWPEKLPTRDEELEIWWRNFLDFRDWGEPVYLRARSEADRRGIQIKQVCEELASNAQFAFGRIYSQVVMEFHRCYKNDDTGRTALRNGPSKRRKKRNSRIASTRKPDGEPAVVAQP